MCNPESLTAVSIAKLLAKAKKYGIDRETFLRRYESYEWINNLNLAYLGAAYRPYDWVNDANLCYELGLTNRPVGKAPPELTEKGRVMERLCEIHLIQSLLTIVDIPTALAADRAPSPGQLLGLPSEREE